jgi:hypothetical protein
MKVVQLTPIDPGNPFLSDAFHMGTQVGNNVTVMYWRFPTEHHDYLIVVDTSTGERIRIEFPKQEG